MDIETIKTKAADLATEFQVMLTQFENATGVVVEDVSLKRFAFSTVGGVETDTLTAVGVHIRDTQWSTQS